MSRKYKMHNKEGMYFISFATVNWIDVFVRQEYFTIMIDSLNYCIKNKGLVLYAYCIMPSHVHMIFSDNNSNPSILLKEIKSYTSKQLRKAIAENPVESRKDWILAIMTEKGKKNSNVKEYQFWQQHNQPIELYSNHIIDQKIDYIHNNPVKASFVIEPYEWKYSSARDYCGEKGFIEVCLIK